MDPRLLAHALKQAPRYTSYPSARHFDHSVDSDVHAGWLAALPVEAQLSLYLHVPYCREICWYCGCNTQAAQRDEPLEAFVDLMAREIDLVAGLSPASRVGEIHWGGGTPNILSAEAFTRIHRHLDRRFDCSSVRRHAIELDPRHLTPEKIATYAAAGVNRASLGVQDLNAHVQRAIGRVQPFEQVRAAVKGLRDAGIAHLAFDLMFGLPGQSQADLRATVHLAAGLRPQRIALFGYAHVPWFKSRQRLIDEQALPAAAERFAQAEAARTELLALGYVTVGLDHFALPQDELAMAASDGRLRRNFQGYVVGQTDALLGLGPSAISTLPHGYAQNLAEVGGWGRRMAAGRPATQRGRALSADDRRRGALIEQIMCDFAGDLSVLGGAAACTKELAALAPLVTDGLVAIEGDRLLVPEIGRPFCRLVAQAFDAYAHPGNRHSAAA